MSKCLEIEACNFYTFQIIQPYSQVFYCGNTLKPVEFLKKKSLFQITFFNYIFSLRANFQTFHTYFCYF